MLVIGDFNFLPAGELAYQLDAPEKAAVKWKHSDALAYEAKVWSKALGKLVELGEAEEVGEARREVGEVGWEVGWKSWEETGGGLRLSRAVLLRTSLVPVHVDNRQGVGGTVIVQHHGGLVAVLLQVELQGVAVLCGVTKLD